ncbi:cobalamin binding intrinsic factor, partial [Biomphalaria glabrata]
MFNFHVDVAYKANENLLYYLERSVEINKDLSFTAEFFPEHDGYMITSINNVSGSKDEETWWSIEKEPEGIMLDR